MFDEGLIIDGEEHAMIFGPFLKMLARKCLLFSDFFSKIFDVSNQFCAVLLKISRVFSRCVGIIFLGLA